MGTHNTKTCPDCGKTGIVRMAMHEHFCPARMEPEPEPAFIPGPPSLLDAVDVSVAEAAIEPEAFNADEPVAERKCIDCAAEIAEAAVDAYADDEPTVDLTERLAGHVPHTVEVGVHVHLTTGDRPFRDEIIDMLWRDIYSLLESAEPQSARIEGTKRSLARLVELAKEG